MGLGKAMKHIEGIVSLDLLYFYIIFSDYNSYRNHYGFYDLTELGIEHCLRQCCRGRKR